MIDWLRRLFRGPNLDRILDSYAQNRVDLLPAILKAIQFQRSQESTVWIVAHFADQVFELQNQLFETGIEHKILAEPIEPNQLVQITLNEPDIVHLALAELLVPAERRELEREHKKTIAIISVERHPLLSRDKLLERFVGQIPSKTRFGYYLSLEDPAISPFVGETTLKVLKHLGMQQGDLIHSLAVTKAIDRGLKRVGSTFDPTARADSAQGWLAIQAQRKTPRHTE